LYAERNFGDKILRSVKADVALHWD